MITKEIYQLLRDYGTIITMICIPLLEVILFALIINTNPKHLPMAVVSADYSNLTRSFIKGLENTEYFDVTNDNATESEAEKDLLAGKIQFILNIPPNFSQDLIRGNRPNMLLTADATNSLVIVNATNAAQKLTKTVFDPELQGTVTDLKTSPQQFDLIIEEKYNPDANPQYFSVPGLIGVILSLTMITLTSISITRENDRNTMESLLITPVKPMEVMLGKLIPSVFIGYIQITLILILSIYFFDVPFRGSMMLLLVSALPFIVSCLGIGLVISTFAKTQFHSLQLEAFYFLPSLLLSGFLFPFQGMPIWAQWIGQILPLTHFLRIAVGIMIKGNNLMHVWGDLWPILVFMVAIIMLGVAWFRKTLD